MQPVCKTCGNTEYVSVSRTRTSIVEYCQNCGNEHREDRDIPLEKWVDKKHQNNQRRVANLRNVK